jgi:hypothetical protein
MSAEIKTDLTMIFVAALLTAAMAMSGFVLNELHNIQLHMAENKKYVSILDDMHKQLKINTEALTELKYKSLTPDLK